MHCPNCGQSQTADDVRYCSRCGLSLWELARWLNDGANAPWHPVQPSIEPSPRRKGIRRGAKLMFLSGVLLVPTIALVAAESEGGFLVVPFTVFVAGLFWALYYRLFVDDTPAFKSQAPAQLYRANEYLPPMQNPPVLRAREPNTAEIVQPPSVTEYTTNLLRDRKKT